MKKITLISLIAVSMGIAIFSSCKVLDVKKDLTFSVSMTVNESGATFDEIEMLDPVAENSDFEDYKNLLKDITIQKVEYTLTYFNGASTQQINSATLDVADADGNGTEQLATVSDVNLQTAQNTTTELSLNEAGMNRLEELILNSPHQVRIHYFGTANEGPMDFVVKFIITVKMTANPL